MADEQGRVPRATDIDFSTDEPGAGAPVVYVDGIAGSIITNNVVKFNLYCDRPSIRPVLDQHGNKGVKPNRRVVITVAMDINNFYAMSEAMRDFFQALIDRGMITRETAGEPGGVEANRDGRSVQNEER